MTWLLWAHAGIAALNIVTAASLVPSMRRGVALRLWWAVAVCGLACGLCVASAAWLIVGWLGG